MNTTTQRPSDQLSARDGWIALGYYVLYVAHLFWYRENEVGHWLTLALIPLGISYIALHPRTRSFAGALASLGFQRGRLLRGVGWALLAGAAITVFQAFGGGRAAAVQQLIRSGRALWLLPLSFLIMLMFAAFTEEVMFRGFLQTRVERLLRSRWLAFVLVAFLFGVYHIPYAYFIPQWPSHGNWELAIRYGLADGMMGGLLVGGLYMISGNLVACIVLHALINAAPGMTIIHFGGGH